MLLSRKSWSDRKSTRLNSSHTVISYAVFCLKKKEHMPTLQSNRRNLSRLVLEILPGEEKTTRMSDSALEELRLRIPAARALTLLEVLAREAEGDVVLDFLRATRLRVAVSPC